jgi:hypothetical protein
MAAQHSTVKNISVHFWHPIDFDFLDLRSQHRVNKYNKNPISERINAAAGIDASMPKLCNEKRINDKLVYVVYICCWKSLLL